MANKGRLHGKFCRKKDIQWYKTCISKKDTRRLQPRFLIDWTILVQIRGRWPLVLPHREIFPSIFISVFVFILEPGVIFIHPSVHLFVHMQVHMSVYLLVHPSTHQELGGFQKASESLRLPQAPNCLKTSDIQFMRRKATPVFLRWDCNFPVIAAPPIAWVLFCPPFEIPLCQR